MGVDSGVELPHAIVALSAIVIRDWRTSTEINMPHAAREGAAALPFRLRATAATMTASVGAGGRHHPTSRKWRNWQTHQLEGLAFARTWGFESPLSHHSTQAGSAGLRSAITFQNSDLSLLWRRHCRLGESALSERSESKGSPIPGRHSIPLPKTTDDAIVVVWPGSGPEANAARGDLRDR